MVLYVDCQEVSSQEIDPKGPITVNGLISIAKMVQVKQSVPVSPLQFKTIFKNNSLVFSMFKFVSVHLLLVHSLN